jgi:hypothetical protein
MGFGGPKVEKKNKYDLSTSVRGSTGAGFEKKKTRSLIPDRRKEKAKFPS